MQNIFDLFNDRKQGIMSLVEGAQVDFSEDDMEVSLEGIDLGLDESFFVEYGKVLEGLSEIDAIEEASKIKAMSDKLVELDDKFTEKIYAVLAKTYRKPESLQKVIDSDMETIKHCEEILAKRESEESKVKALLKEAGRLTVWTLTGGFSAVFSDKMTPSALFKQIKRYSEIFVKVAKKRLAELEDKAIKESLEGFVIEESFITEYTELLESIHEFDSIEDMDVVEEAVKEKAKQAYDKLIELDNKLAEKLYQAVSKVYRNPEKLQKIIDRDKATVERCDKILKGREESDDSKVKAIAKEAGRLAVFGLLSSLALGPLLLKSKNLAPSTLLKDVKRYNNLFIKVANKRIDELEAKKAKPATESADIVEVKYETLEEAFEALDGIIKESTMEFIEFQSANYLEDLVLESMMYEEFNEEKMEAALEATIKDRMTKAADGIKAQWAKLAAWFEEILRIITNLFVDGSKLVRENSTKIGPAMKACSAKVNMVDYKPMGPAVSECTSMMMDLKGNAAAQGASKASVLGAIGAKDDKSVSEVVRKLFMSDSRSEKAISSIDPKLAMSYAGDGKQVIDGIKKTKATMDKDFKEIERLVRSSANGKGEDVMNMLTLFKYASNLRMRIVNQEIACIKKGHFEFIAIIKKALKSYKPAGLPEPNNKVVAKESTELEFVDEEDGE